MTYVTPFPDKRLDGRHVPGLSDEIGERVLILDDRGDPSLELLRFRQTLTTIPGFEVALRRRVERLRLFRHPAFAKTPAVEYLGQDHSLALLSTYTPGTRLSELLAYAQDPAFATSLIHQLTPAIDALHDYADDGIGHGALTASRIAVSPEGQLMVVEHVLGPALDRLHLTAAGMRRDLGIPVPETDAGQPRPSGTTDCFQLALIVLSMLLGRALKPDEHTEQIGVLNTVFDRESLEPIAGLRVWLERALLANGDAFASSKEAKDALADVGVPATNIADRWRELLEIREGAGGECVALELPAEEEDEEEPAAARAEDEQPALAAPEPADISVPVVEDVEQPASQPSTLVQPAGLQLPVFQPATFQPAAFRPIAIRPVASHASAQGLRQRLRTVFHVPARSVRWPVAALTLCVLVETIVIAALLEARWRMPPAPIADVTLTTADPGAAVTIDGRSAGVTPLQLAIGPEIRSISIESPRPPPPKQELIVGSTGQEQAALDAARGRIGADPRARYSPAPAPPPRPGAIKVSSPIELEVFEGDTRLGSSATGILSAAPGRRELDFVNSALGYRSRQVVEIKTGQTLSLSISPPNGRLNINAVPWAEILVDGKSVGETPIGNLSIPIGEHEIVFRHPQLGEVRRTAIVRSDGVTRVSANLQR